MKLQEGKCVSFLSGRSPCGERGLKYHRLRKQKGFKSSLPVRGAWIEMMR